MEILNSSPKIQTAPEFCSPLSTHLEHEVFVEVWIKVGEVITARRAPALAPFVGKEAHSEKSEEKGFIHVIALSKSSSSNHYLTYVLFVMPASFVDFGKFLIFLMCALRDSVV